MNKNELKIKLDELGISTDDYLLDGDVLPMRTILRFYNGDWKTFEYDERGGVADLKTFKDEDSACKDMYERLKYLKEWRIKTKTI